MNTYKVDERICKGVNLLSAIESLGFTDVRIIPLWRNKSDGKYKAYCSEKAILRCEWIEKVNSLKKNK